jgi:TRAP-type uncharacterized transport system substrate-binding protein
MRYYTSSGDNPHGLTLSIAHATTWPESSQQEGGKMEHGPLRALTRGLFGGALLAAACLAPAHAVTFITIGSGGVTGVFYPTGGAICRLVNKDR